MTDDEREQAYEDQMWDEFPNRAIAAVVSTWDDSTTEIVLAAFNQAAATLAEEATPST